MAASATSLEYVQKMYIAYFGRPAAPTGQEYYGQLVDAGNIAALQDDFWNSAESQALFNQPTTEGKVNAIFNQLFGRDAETAGLTYWTVEINAGRVSLPSAALTILNSASAADAAVFDAKMDVADAFTGELDSTSEILAYQSNTAGGRTTLSAIETQAAADAAVASIDTIVAVVVAGGSSETDTFALTNGTDIKTAHIFTSNQVYTPGGNDRINSLQDEDQLSGTDLTDDRLDATLGNPGDNGGVIITPKMTGIEIVNVAFTGSVGGVNQLDLQDATGVTNAINITRVSDGLGTATIDNIDTVPVDLSVSNSGQPNQAIAFGFKSAAVSGNADTTTLTISDVQVAALSVQERSATAGLGIETINLKSTGAAGTVNTIGVLNIEDVSTLNVSGDQNLTLGTTGTVVNAQNLVEASRVNAGLGNVAGSLTSVNASTFTGNLNYVIGNEINAGLDNTSGQSVNLSVLGGSGNDTFTLAAGASVDAADTIDGGTGTNNVFVTYGGTSTITGTANIKGLNALEVRTGHDAVVAPDAVTINADAFAALTSVYVRNEGQQQVAGVWTSAAEGSTVNLNNLTDVQARAITVAHGTTGNSTIANNIVNVAFKTAGVANATQVTIVDGTNIDPVFNLNLGAASSELVTIVDNDTESNSVLLRDAARTQAGSTLTVLPGDLTDAGSYMNFDAVAAALATVADTAGVNDYVAGRVGFGRATDGSLFSNTIWLNRESAEQVTLAAVATRDAAASNVFYGSNGAAADGLTRTVFENIVAGDYAGNVEVRLGDVTRADGVSSMKITTGTGNDTFIFDAIGVVNSGFTSGDSITAGTGTDTLVLDGNTATIPGTPRINHQTSEWDNLKGVDVLQFANNAGVANVGNGAQVANIGGAYYARIDNDFITQTDAANRLTVVNNDGDLTTNSESDLVLDLRGLSQDKWITFIGANANGAAGNASNRLVVDDISANQNMILNGGDTDVRISTTVGYVAGNNNVYEVRNTSNVSINDLAQTSNFGLINFTNDQAVAQTLTLTLNNTVVEALVDSSNAATSAATQEILNIVANDQFAVASILNVDASAVTGFHGLNVTGSVAGNDILTLNSNVGGSSDTVNAGASTGDRVNWTGGAAAMTVAINTGTGVSAFTVAPTTTTHTINGVEIVDLTNLTYASSAITGQAAIVETFIAGMGTDVMTGGAAADTFVIANTGSNTLVVASSDSVTDFVAGTDFLSLGVAATAANFTFVAGAAASYAAALAAANVAFAADAGGAKEYYVGNDGANAYVFIDNGADGVAAEQVIVLTGAAAQVLTTADIIA